MANFMKSPLSSPPTLDPNEYFNVSPEKRRADEARAALRANLKRQYQLQLNNPARTELIEDPALKRWEYARNNIYPNFRATKKTSLLAGIFGLMPMFAFYYLFKTNRDNKEEKIKAGTLDRRFRLST